MNHFSIGLWCAMTSGFYTKTAVTSSVAGPAWEEAPKHFPKSYMHQKKSHGHCLVACCSFDPLQLSESRWNHYMWEVRPANWGDAQKTEANTGQQNGPNSPQQYLTTCLTTNASKVEWIGPWSFASSAIFTWPLANRLSFPQASWQPFSGKMLPQPAGGRKHFLIVHQISKHGFVQCRNK